MSIQKSKVWHHPKKKTIDCFQTELCGLRTVMNRYELRDVRNQHISISTNREQIRINVSYFYVYSHINDDKWCFHNGWSKIYYWLFNFRNSNRKYCAVLPPWMQNAKRNSNITESVWLHKEKYNKQMTSNFRLLISW